jgi:hypothetical protein
MNFKSVSPWWALCLVALSGAAHADLEPFTLGASESIQHQSNVNRAPEAERVSDWISVTEFDAALDQTIGRQRLTASGTFDVNRYKKEHSLDANAYSVAGALNWETVGDLTGAIGADSRRRQYFYGLDGELQSPGSGSQLGRNLETDNHVFANAQLGGLARWTLFAGADANNRKYSNPLFDANEERQWSANAGTRYATSPDLSFGITGNLTRGLYPNFIIGDLHDDFNSKSIDLTTKWQATGVSELDASIGYSDAHYTGQSPSKFLNGSLNWNWTPPSHFTVSFGLSRDTNADTQVAAAAQPNSNDLTGRSINNVAHLSVGYALSAKTTLSLNAQYTDRHYSNAVVPTLAGGTESIDGSNRATLIGLSAQYQPTRITSLSCSVSREQLKADASIIRITPNYSDNIAQCTAAIKFD